jgi:hypothetical protein
MKRVLVLLSLVAALFIAGGCTYDTDLSVTASAELYYDNGDIVNVAPVTYRGYHMTYLSDVDLEDIFLDLTQHVKSDFRTATLYLEIYDDISGRFLRNETYGVIYNTRTGYYDFAEI